jgi:hypothetical protein
MATQPSTPSKPTTGSSKYDADTRFMMAILVVHFPKGTVPNYKAIAELLGVSHEGSTMGGRMFKLRQKLEQEFGIQNTPAKEGGAKRGRPPGSATKVKAEGTPSKRKAKDDDASTPKKRGRAAKNKVAVKDEDDLVTPPETPGEDGYSASVKTEPSQGIKNESSGLTSPVKRFNPRAKKAIDYAKLNGDDEEEEEEGEELSELDRKLLADDENQDNGEEYHDTSEDQGGFAQYGDEF